LRRSSPLYSISSKAQRMDELYNAKASRRN
jgi:hypothetical protein